MEVVIWASIIGALIGAFLAVVGGVYTAHRTLNIRDKKDKVYVSRALLSEVEENQNRLRKIIDFFSTTKNFKQIGRSTSVNLDKDINQAVVRYSKLCRISFDRIVYSSLSHKIGLLEDKSLKNVFQYYAKIKFIEDTLSSIPNLFSIGFSEEEIQAYITFVSLGCLTDEKVYKMGEELIKSLKEKKADGGTNNIN